MLAISSTSGAVWAVLLAGVCLLAQTHHAGGKNASIIMPDYSVYLKKDDLLQKVRDVVAAHPKVMKYESRHAADGDYKADMMVVTVEPAGLSPTHKLKARLLIDFGEHGREFITSEVALRLLEVLGDADKLSQLVGGGRRAARLQAILQHTAFKILPMENIAGRDLVEAGNVCERKNGRGVDPNRNWDIDWGKKEKDYDPKEEYPGKGPLSEPEVQIVLELAKELKPHVWLNMHSGMYALFTPYDHKGHVPNTTDARAALRLLGRIKDLICPQCAIGSGGHTVGYLAHGTATDYMFEVLKIPMSFTWEIYGDEKASYEDCFRMFNPIGKQQQEEVITLWTKALLQLVELLPTHPATWPIFKDKGLERWEAVLGQQNGTAAATDASSQAAAGGDAAATSKGNTSTDAVQQKQQQEQQIASPSPSPQQPSPSPEVQQQPSPSPELPAPPRVPPPQQEQPQPQPQPRPQQPDQQQVVQDITKTAAAAPVDLAGAALGGPPSSDQQQLLPTGGASGADTEVSLLQQAGDGAAVQDGWHILRAKGVLPLVVCVAGLAGVVYAMTRPERQGPAYTRLGRDRLPTRRS